MEKDYEEFLALLNKHEVRYCVIGALIVKIRLYPRNYPIGFRIKPIWNCYYSINNLGQHLLHVS